MLVRLSHSHIRIGSFQRAATLGDEALLRALTDYALKMLYDATPGDNPAAQLLSLVVERTADLAASYMIAGFVHGVLNSDNINVTGESFDYGPWRFTPRWEAGFTAAYFDHQGLYAFARQAEAIHWDVAQLALSLRALSATEPLVDALNMFPDLYAAAMRRRFCWRLGIVERDAEATSLLTESAVRAMIASKTPIDSFFFDWRGGALRNPEAEGRYAGPEWMEFLQQIAPFANPVAARHYYWQGDAPCSMHIEEVEAIWAAIDARDDWSLLDAKITQIGLLREAMMQA